MAAIPQAGPSPPNVDVGPAILGTTISMTLLALCSLSARLFVRLRMIRNVGWDDYMMCIAMALSIAGMVVVIPQVRHGAGRHIQYIDPADFVTGLKLNFITQPIYLFAIMFIKQSVGFFLLRLASRGAFRWWIMSIMIFMGVYTVGCFFTIMFQCTDIRIQWDPTVKATCWTPTTLRALSYTNAALNILTDLLFAIVIPIPMLWKVQMNKRTKASLMCILGLGTFASAACIVKTVYLTSYGKTGDWLWDSRNLTIWTITETQIGIIAGNLPCLKPLFRRVLGSTLGSRGRSKDKVNYYSKGYATGTNRSGIPLGYGHLGSKTPSKSTGHDEEFVLETHISAKGVNSDIEDGVSGAENDNDASSKMSDESVSRLNKEIGGRGGFGGLSGGITKTTTVATKVGFVKGEGSKEGLAPEWKPDTIF